MNVIPVGVMTALLLMNYPTSDPSWLKPPARVTLAVSAVPSATPARSWTVRVDVTPAAGIHVYAPGNDNYIAVALSLNLPEAVRSTTAVYPPGEPYVFGETKEVVRVYQRPFRITQSISLQGAGAKPPATLSGALRYQACTDKVCFPPQTEPFTVALPASQPAGGKRTNSTS